MDFPALPSHVSLPLMACSCYLLMGGFGVASNLCHLSKAFFSLLNPLVNFTEDHLKLFPLQNDKYVLLFEHVPTQ